jgi:hypothetical protein
MRNRHDAQLGINRMIVAYHRPRNIKYLLFPRRLRENQYLASVPRLKTRLK